MTQAEDRITGFIVDNFLFGDTTRMPAPGDSLVETGVIDSTGVLELIEFLGEELGVHVEDDETVPGNLDSIERLTTFVARKQALAARTA